MKRILVFSDSHGYLDHIREILKKETDALAVFEGSLKRFERGFFMNIKIADRTLSLKANFSFKEKIEIAKDQADKANRAKTDFLSSIRSELTP